MKFEKIKAILTKFKNNQITQDAAEDQLMEIMCFPETEAKDFSSVEVNYDELAKALMRNDPDYAPKLMKEEIKEEPLTADWEKELLVKALMQTNGNRKNASLLLGISERTIYRKLLHYSIDASKYKKTKNN